jgi:hypothetical protein
LRWSRYHSFAREIAARFDDLGVSLTNMVMASPNVPQQIFLTRSDNEIFTPGKSAWLQVIAIPQAISIYSEIPTRRQFDRLEDASERYTRARMENANVRITSAVLMQPQRQPSISAGRKLSHSLGTRTFPASTFVSRFLDWIAARSRRIFACGR